MSKTPTLASVAGATLSGQELKTFLTGSVAAFRTAGMQETDRATITSDTTLTVQNCGLVLVDCTGGNVALTLPTSGSTTDDAIYNIRRLDSTTNTLTVNRGGSDTIEGSSAAVSIGAQINWAIQLPAGGTDWKVTGRSIADVNPDAGLGPATTSASGHVELATNAETQAGTDTERAVTPAGLASVTATETRAGLVELATNAEAEAGSDTARAVTPAGVAAAIAANDAVKVTKSNTSTTDGNDTISLTGLGITTNDSASVSLRNYRTSGSALSQGVLDLRFNGVSTSTYYSHLSTNGPAGTARRVVANFDRGQFLGLTMRIWRNGGSWDFEGTVSYRNDGSWITGSFAGSWASDATIDTIAFFTPSSETTLDQASLYVKKHSPGIF